MPKIMVWLRNCVIHILAKNHISVKHQQLVIDITTPDTDMWEVIMERKLHNFLFQLIENSQMCNTGQHVLVLFNIVKQA